MARNFLVSVANVVARDPSSGKGIFRGTSNISSAFTMSTTAAETRGGVGNALLYVYYHSKKVDIKIESATFDKTFLGLNAGSLATTGNVTAIYDECVTLANGVGVCTNTPLSDVTVYFGDGTIQNITPVGKTFTTVGGGAQSVNIDYDYSVSADRIVVSATLPPMLVDLVMFAEVRDDSRALVSTLQIRVPRFQISGNNSLAMAANGLSNSSLEGMALAVQDSTCAGGDYFATITYIPVTAASVTYSEVVAMPSALVFSVAAGLPSSQNVTVLAISGATNAKVTTSASFAMTAGSMVNTGKWTVGSHTGLVTAGSAMVAGESGSIVVSYLSGSTTLTDWVNLSVTA